MPTLFTKIISGEIPGTFVWRDDKCVAFMTIAPISPGHALVVPTAEVDHWIDLGHDLRDHLMAVATQIGKAIDHVYRPEKVGLMIAGLEVPHTHIHILPVNDLNGLDFARADHSATRDDLEVQANKIRQALEAMGADGASR